MFKVGNQCLIQPADEPKVIDQRVAITVGAHALRAIYVATDCRVFQPQKNILQHAPREPFIVGGPIRIHRHGGQSSMAVSRDVIAAHALFSVQLRPARPTNVKVAVGCGDDFAEGVYGFDHHVTKHAQVMPTPTNGKDR